MWITKSKLLTLTVEKLNIPELTGTNYFISALKIKSTLSLKRLGSVLSEVEPKGLNEKDSKEWDQKNADAVTNIKLSLLDEQFHHSAGKENAKILWKSITIIDLPLQYSFSLRKVHFLWKKKKKKNYYQWQIS